jgi:hypothetical protein
MAGRDNISLLKVMATLVTHNDAAPLESEALMQWIVEQGLQGISMSEVYEGFCTRLVAGGMQIQRGLCGMRSMRASP